MTATTVATYVFLGLAVLGLWARRFVWVSLLIAAVVLGYTSGVLVQPAALWIALLAAACLAYEQARAGRIASHVVRSGAVGAETRLPSASADAIASDRTSAGADAVANDGTSANADAVASNGPRALADRGRRAPSARSASSTRARAALAAAVAIVAIIMLSVLLGLHALPGFHNALVVKDLVLTPGAAPYTLYLNFDKTAAGILIVGICCRAQLARGWHDFGSTLRRAAPIIAINTVALVCLSMVLGFLRFDPKWTPFFWTWAPVNLFFTCLSEEAFFRGFIQQGLQDAFSSFQHAPTIALVASALLFGLAHFAGGWTYVALAAVAGFGYGFAFQRTGRLEASITAHFTLNALHFLLFTYPRAL